MLDPAAHERFGPFLIIRPLGRGGMGEVYVARTPWEANPVAALKRLRPDVARVPTFPERFKHEADLAVRLNHRHVVGTLHVGAVGEQLYVASELVLGKDAGQISDRCRERGISAPGPMVLRMAIDVLSALAYVHGVREPDGTWLALVHRDVTPGNVLVGYDGLARLADFGLAKSDLTQKYNLTGHGEILGTPHYLAPEVIEGKKATASSDIYGLGAVMYRVLTGAPPFQGTAVEVLTKALTERPRPLEEVRSDLPAPIVELVSLMMEPDPKRRPNDAEALRQRIEELAEEIDVQITSAALGRWVAQIFGEERVKELLERERLLKLAPFEEEPPEPTRVIACVREDSFFGSTADWDPKNRPQQRPLGEESFDDETSRSVETRWHEGGWSSNSMVHKQTARDEAQPLAGDLTQIDDTSPRIDGLLEAMMESGEGEDEATAIDTPTKARSLHPSVYPVPPDAPSGEPPLLTEEMSRPRSLPAMVRPVQMPSPPTPSRPGRRRTEQQRPVVLSILLSSILAILTGVGLGALIAEQVRPANTARSDLTTRLEQLRVRVEQRQSRGQSVSPRIWECLARAGEALLDDSPDRARTYLDEAERLLVSSP